MGRWTFRFLLMLTVFRDFVVMMIPLSSGCGVMRVVCCGRVIMLVGRLRRCVWWLMGRWYLTCRRCILLVWRVRVVTFLIGLTVCALLWVADDAC